MADNFDVTNMEAAKEAVAMLPRLKEITEHQESAASQAREGTLFSDMGELPALNMHLMLTKEQTEGYKLCSDLQYSLGLAAENDPEELARLKAISYRPEICQRTAGPEAISEYRDLRTRFLAATDILREIENKKRGSSTPAKTQQTKSGGCYVATAVYGSYDCPQVWTLRRYRDIRLQTTILGRTFVKIYYVISPHLVRAVGAKQWFVSLTRKPLDAFVGRLNRDGIDDKPYSDAS